MSSSCLILVLVIDGKPAEVLDKSCCAAFTPLAAVTGSFSCNVVECPGGAVGRPHHGHSGSPVFSSYLPRALGLLTEVLISIAPASGDSWKACRSAA